MVMPKSSICFREAYDLRKEGRIQLEEYLKRIVAHYEGHRHETDAEGNRPFLYAGFEDEVRQIVLGTDFQPLDEDGECAASSYLWHSFDCKYQKRHLCIPFL